MTDNNSLITALNQLVIAEGNKTEAARSLGIPRTTFNDMIDKAERLGLSPTILPPSIEAKISAMELKHKAEVKELNQRLTAALRDGLETDFVRKEIFGLAEYSPKAPAWTFEAPPTTTGFAGVPTLMISDVHWGEVVKPEEVGNHNEFNREIAVERMKRTFEGAVDLATNHVIANKIPGIVLALGGDMVSGDIHYELAKTNDGEVLEHVFDLFDNLVEGIDALAATFGNVFVPCAYGNHGRNTVKPMHKSAAATNFDWLLYNMLERHYKTANKNVRFSVPRGFDTLYNIYSTNFCLTHGDRLGAAGGKGQIGAIAPIARGMKNIKAQYNTLGQHIDYVLMGHWHTLMEIPNEGFVNGSLKGFDEFAAGHRFAPEKPAQIMFWTHPRHGITFRTPIYVEGGKADQPASSPWVSWQS